MDNRFDLTYLLRQENFHEDGSVIFVRDTVDWWDRWADEEQTIEQIEEAERDMKTALIVLHMFRLYIGDYG